MGIGIKELIVILVIVMLMFGTKKIRGIGSDVGGWIRDFKKALKDGNEESQADLADRLGVSRNSINAIETGKYDPSLPLAFRIARLFDRPIEAVFDDGFSPAEP